MSRICVDDLHKDWMKNSDYHCEYTALELKLLSQGWKAGEASHQPARLSVMLRQLVHVCA